MAEATTPVSATPEKGVAKPKGKRTRTGKKEKKNIPHAIATVQASFNLIAGDLGCLMNMAGKLKREGSPIHVRHVAEVLAGDSVTAPIAEAE